MIVVDASIALAWILEPDNTVVDAALAETVRGGAIVPGNFATEVVHVLLVREREAKISRLAVSRAIEHLAGLRIEAVSLPWSLIADVARKHRLTGYDASYLALAIEQGISIATIDKALATAARAEKRLWVASSSMTTRRRR